MEGAEPLMTGSKGQQGKERKGREEQEGGGDEEGLMGVEGEGKKRKHQS